MQRKEIQRGDLFYYDFGKREGSVQSGERPVMVIQADNCKANAPTIIVAAVTAVMKKKYLPSHIILGEDFGLKKPSMVLLEQIQTVNKDELTDYIGSVNDERLWKQINAALKKAAEGELKGIMGYNELPLVSRDYNGCPLSSIVDGLSTMMVGPRMAKVVAWYDNEWGYSNRVVDLACYIASKGL